MSRAGNDEPPRPALSVVITSRSTWADAERCVATIEANCAGEIEIIIVDLCLTDGPALRSTARYIGLPPKTPLARMLGEGIGGTRGNIIAITDSTCVVNADWIQSILRAHAETPEPVVGGCVEMLAGGTLTDWAAFFSDYGQFMQPAPHGTAAALPGNNLSIKRSALSQTLAHGSGQFWKTHWCRELQSQGVKLISDPKIVVHCHKSYKFAQFLRGRFHRGRCFAAMRTDVGSASRRIVFAAGSLLLPLLIIFRTVLPPVRRKRFLRKLVLTFPVIALGAVCWSAGELLGYSFGAGKSAQRAD